MAYDEPAPKDAVVQHIGWSSRWCPLCNRRTRFVTDHQWPPMVIVTCGECGFVHRVSERTAAEPH